MKMLTALMALTILAGCNRLDSGSARRDRTDRLYQAAMDDYQAGRLDAAMKGFEEAVKKNPQNASARFQFACLLQDTKHDYLRALCGYHEYMLLSPGSDKAKVVSTRLALCEKELAKALAEKYGLSVSKAHVGEIEALNKGLKAAETRAIVAEKELASVKARLAALSAERERLLAIVKNVGNGDGNETQAAVAKPSVVEAKDLLEEEDDTERESPAEGVAKLRAEEEDELDTGASILPQQKIREAKQRNGEAPATVKKVTTFPQHPPTYVVKDGDTLYGLAKRFYGRMSAWKLIRKANRALISADNRLHVGDTIRLP